jgi:hypothetical protein
VIAIAVGIGSVPTFGEAGVAMRLLLVRRQMSWGDGNLGTLRRKSHVDLKTVVVVRSGSLHK